MNRFKKALLGATCAAALIGSGPTTAEAQNLYAWGSNIWVKFVGYSAAYTNDLYFFPSFPGAGQFLFSNQGALAAAPGQQFLASNTMSVNQEIVFGIFVRNTNKWYYTGDASRNSDNTLHAQLTDLGGGQYQVRVGFEDLQNGGDQDYNDLIFDVAGARPYVTPEPISMVLLGSGLFGVGGVAGLRKRRKGQESRA